LELCSTKTLKEEKKSITEKRHYESAGNTTAAFPGYQKIKFLPTPPWLMKWQAC
jgi:hypothetical protein